ncbi:MAG TPA: ACT domain-containing protein, partial [Pseudonocardiaceae bacterium]|nr:ACT domain-containing protein [Pseudonocardiaceae bacterium]
MTETPVLITVTGPDKPGVSSVLFSALAVNNADMLDVEQVVIHGKLVLGVLVATRTDPEGLQEAVEQAMASVGMQVEVEIGTERNTETPAQVESTHVLVVLGHPVTAKGFTRIARRLAKLNANIDAITRVADYPVTGLELRVSVADDSDEADERLRSVLGEAAADVGLDIGIERAGLARRAKRLIVFDVDSTLIQGEVI